MRYFLQIRIANENFESFDRYVKSISDVLKSNPKPFGLRANVEFEIEKPTRDSSCSKRISSLLTTKKITAEILLHSDGRGRDHLGQFDDLDYYFDLE